MIFARERCEQVISDIVALILLHHAEISKYKEIPLEPDFERYFKIEAIDILRIYTARKEKELVGYQFYFISQHAHYRSTKCAHQDLLFIHPDHRGFGYEFMGWCEGQLKAEGVGIVYNMVTSRFDYSPLLRRMRYEPLETVYSKRLSKD